MADRFSTSLPYFSGEAFHRLAWRFKTLSPIFLNGLKLKRSSKARFRLVVAIVFVSVLPFIATCSGPHDSAVRPFGPRAPWNVPVTRLRQHPDSDIFVDRLWREAPANLPGNFNLGFDEYTYPIYYAQDATGLYPVVLDNGAELSGKTIPWNPAWQPAPGTDAQVVILDREKGFEWDLWQVRFDGKTVHASNGSRVSGDYRVKEDGHPPSRGVGIAYLAMLARPHEFEQGAILHALSMPIRNTDGDYFVAPATKLEHPGRMRDGIPEGMRFALNVSDADIQEWLDGMPKGMRKSTLQSARIIARALRDYGWFITDTAGGATFQFESRLTAGKDWAELGLDYWEVDDSHVYPRDLLDRLLKPERIYAVVPSDEYPADLRARPSR